MIISLISKRGWQPQTASNSSARLGYHDLEIEGWNIAAVMALAGVFGSNVDYMRCDMQLNSSMP